MIVVEVSHEGREVPKNESDCFLWFTIRKKSFRKTWLESKWNAAFWVNPAENFLEKRNIWKGSSVFQDGMFQTEIRVPFLQSRVTSFMPSPAAMVIKQHSFLSPWVTYSIIAWIGFKSPTSHVKYLMHACWSRCFRSLSPCANGRNIVGY